MCIVFVYVPKLLCLESKDPLEAAQNEENLTCAHAASGPYYVANFKPLEGTVAMDWQLSVLRSQKYWLIHFEK